MVLFHSHFLAGLKNIFPGCQIRNITFRNPITDPAEKIARPQLGRKFAKPILPGQTFVLQLGLGHNRRNAVVSTRDQYSMSLFQPGKSPYSTRKRWFLLFSAALVAIFVACKSHGDELSAKTQPNIVFIFTDDHACQAIGAYGSQINQTPNIDRIGRAGMVFENSFCANSICGPSRACILTGKHSHKNGFFRNGNQFNPHQTTFPPLLKKAGYQTALVGKWHLGTDPVGFDYWEVLPGQGHYYNPDFKQMNGRKKRRQGYCTDIITDLAIEWLKNGRSSERPFMLMCQHKAPHRNWAPAARHFSMFSDREVPEPETLFDDYSGRTSLLKENEMSVRNHFHWKHDMKFHGPTLFPEVFVDKKQNAEYDRMTPAQKQSWDEHYGQENQDFIRQMEDGSLSDPQILSWKYQRYIKDYLRCIAAVDEGVGKLLDYLDEASLAENTIVIYCSDQGFYLGEHGWYDKRWMFEESLKMPLLVRWPGVISAGTRSKELVQNIDYAPTFLEIAGAAVPEEMQGDSLVDICRHNGNASGGWRDAIYYAYYENASVHNVPVHYGIRTQDHKLMYFPRTREWQLFDLQKDPQEMTSVHDKAPYQEILSGLQQRYLDLAEHYEVNTAATPATRAFLPWWKQRSARLQKEAAKRKKVRLLFIGDSITQGWENAGRDIWQQYYGNRQALNLGFSGDCTEHVIWRLNRIGLRKLKPEVAVVMIGTNNRQKPPEIAEGVERILEILEEKTPETQVLLLGIFPRGESAWDTHRLRNLAVNDRIRRFGNRQGVHYLDIGDVFFEPGGTLSSKIMPDGLHLSPTGYQRWATAIEPHLEKLGF